MINAHFLFTHYKSNWSSDTFDYIVIVMCDANKHTPSKTDLPCRLCGCMNNGLFCKIDRLLQEQVNLDKSPYRFEANHAIFREGNPARNIYCIHEGRVKLFKTTNNNHHVIRILGPGDIVGLRPIFSDEPYAATAQTVEKTTVCVIPKKTIIALMEKSPEFTQNVIKILAVELRVSEDQLISLLYDPVKQRTARLILNLLEKEHHHNNDQPQKVSLLKRIEMAQIIGTTPESLSRTLHSLAERGIIKVTRKEIVVLKHDKLVQISGINR